MKRAISVIVVLILTVVIGTIFTRGSEPESAQNVEVRDDIQYVAIDAKGGYSPRTSIAKAGIPTKLVVRTNDTFDCSLALNIHALNFRKTLPSTGEEVIDLGIPKTGQLIQGVCSMGMYSFRIKFD